MRTRTCKNSLLDSSRRQSGKTPICRSFAAVATCLSRIGRGRGMTSFNERLKYGKNLKMLDKPCRTGKCWLWRNGQ